MIDMECPVKGLPIQFSILGLAGFTPYPSDTLSTLHIYIKYSSLGNHTIYNSMRTELCVLYSKQCISIVSP